MSASDYAWVVFGERGFIGSFIVATLREAGCTVESPGDVVLGESRGVIQLLSDLKEKHRGLLRVVCATGVTGKPTVDWCEDHKERTFEGNVTQPLELARICEQLRLHVTFVGSGCIFEGGSKLDPLDEDLAPNFERSWYSHTKAEFERRLFRDHAGAGALVWRIRIPVLAGNPLRLEHAGRCALSKALAYEELSDWPNSVTVLADMIPRGLVLSARMVSGAVNLVNPDPLTMVELRELATSEPYDGPRFGPPDTGLGRLVRTPRSNCVLAPSRWLYLDGESPPGAGRAVLLVRNSELRPEQLAGRLLRRLSTPSAGAGAAPGVLGVPEVRGVLVTGGAGFIGSFVVARLLMKGFRVVVIDSLTYAGRVERIAEAARVIGFPLPDPKRLLVLRQDLADERSLVAAVDQAMLFCGGSFAGGVLHMAAETHVDLSYGGPLKFTRSNVLGTHCLLEALRERCWDSASRSWRFPRFVHVSTDEVHGSVGPGAELKATLALDPTNPYAATKVAAEALVGAYAHSYGLPLVITRGNNVYGPTQTEDKLVGATLRRLLRSEPPVVQGTGFQQRGFLYVTDVARAFELILASGEIGKIYFVTVDEELTVWQVVRRCAEAVRRVAPEVPVDDLMARPVHSPDRPFQDRRYVSGVDPALAALGWRRVVSFDEGLERTARWMLDDKAWRPAAAEPEAAPGSS